MVLTGSGPLPLVPCDHEVVTVGVPAHWLPEHALLEELDTAALAVDPAGEVRRSNAAADRAYAGPDGVLPGRRLASIFAEGDRDALAGVIGGLAGFASGQLLLAFFANGPMLNFYGFIPVALGGLGNNRGAIVSGLILGVFQQAANFTFGGVFAAVAVFTVFIVVLLAAPQGLFGAPQQRRV